MAHDESYWSNLAEALAFCGNSLLAPMNQTSEVGLDPAFWSSFPTFENDEVSSVIERLARYSDAAQTRKEQGVNIVSEASVEYTMLFVGPPKPAAAPWESFYSGQGTTVGFGQATFDMQQRLREAGLQVSNENNQYADHIGIELLYLSVLCSRVSAEDNDALQNASEFSSHILEWSAKLLGAVDQNSPDGYIGLVLRLARSLAELIS